MTTKAETTYSQQAEPLCRAEAEMTSTEKALWGIVFGLGIGGCWMLADFIRPLIYGA